MRAAVAGFYLGTMGGCIALIAAGQIALASHPAGWATAWWHMTSAWAWAGMALAWIANRLLGGSGKPPERVCDAGNSAIAEAQTKAVLRRCALVAFVVVIVLALGSWRSIQFVPPEALAQPAAQQ